MALVKPWLTDAAQGDVSVADPQPDSGSRALQATPLQAPFLEPNRFYTKVRVRGRFVQLFRAVARAQSDVVPTYSALTVSNLATVPTGGRLPIT